MIEVNEDESKVFYIIRYKVLYDIEDCYIIVSLSAPT